MSRGDWVGMASAIAVGVWAGATAYYLTQDLLTCGLLPRLWR